MNRPYLVSFSAIKNDKFISLKLHIANSRASLRVKDQSKKKKRIRPIQSIRLLKKKCFTFQIQGLNQNKELIYNKEFDTDDFGQKTFNIKQPSHIDEEISNFQIFETSTLKGVSIYLGSFIPMEIRSPAKILISDFDKTLVDTKYSSLKELYFSLSKPISYFPAVHKSLEMTKHYIKDGHRPFILSASPHFYEKAIKDWLYKNGIYTSEISLKDYRNFTSIYSGSFASKDLKKQGFYKLTKLIEILERAGLPEELVLFGDGFESDPYIYLTLQSLLEGSDPWQLWKTIRNAPLFSLTQKQDSMFITKFNHIAEMVKKQSTNTKVTIHIRAKKQNIEKLRLKIFSNHYIEKNKNKINYYIA